MGNGVGKDGVAVATWLGKVAELGHPDAAAFLGFCYHTGFAAPTGVEAGDVEAMKWYQRAAHAGNVLAIHNLAICYSWGRGVNHDHPEAVRLLRMYETLQLEIIAVIESLEQLKESAEYELCRIVEQRPGVLGEVAGEQSKLLDQESAELQHQADKLADEIKELNGIEEVGIR